MLRTFLTSMAARVFYSKNYYRLNHDLADKKNNTHIIEIIGPAGVGKSTFIKLLKRRGIISRHKVPKLNIKAFATNYDSVHGFHVKLFRLKVGIETFGSKGLGCFHDMLQWLFRDQYLQLPKYSGRFFLVDEGIGHHFTSELLIANQSDHDLFYEATKNRCFIALTAKPETIANRIMVRKDKKKHILPYHYNKTAQQLEAYLNARLDNIGDLISVASNAGVPCIIINSENNVQKQLKEVESFLRKICAK